MWGAVERGDSCTAGWPSREGKLLSRTIGQLDRSANDLLRHRSQALRKMRRAVFGEPLRAHPPEIGSVGAPGNARLVDHQRDTDCDENRDGQQHGLGPPGTRAVITSIVPDPAARVCAVVHTCTGWFEGASVDRRGKRYRTSIFEARVVGSPP
jgi:hypothetical protein